MVLKKKELKLKNKYIIYLQKQKKKNIKTEL
jgi:hypothetical protein